MKKEALMRKSILVLFCTLSFNAVLFAQSGSINNTLGSGGTFTVKNSSNNAVVVVDEATGQLSATRVKVDGVPSFTVYHIPESDMGATDTLLTWTEGSGAGSHDNSDSFNESTGEFVAPRNGFYFLSAGIELAASASTVTLYIRVNTVVSSLAARSSLSTTAVTNLSTSGVLKLNSGDVVTLRITMVSPAGPGSSGLGWFSGYLVSDF
jgi:hypothetical protein